MKSGLILPEDALRLAYYSGVIFHGIGPLATLRLGDEAVFYEVAIHGKIYRALARPVPGQSERTDARDLKYMLVRSWAPGVCSDGWLLESLPTAIPNTPRALALEMRDVLGLELGDIVENAYSILNYRRHHGAVYPDSMTPPGYTFREAFLMSLDAQGNLQTLYETPKGVNPERWTHFLSVLDRKNRPTLASYVVSSMAVREFGEAGAAAMREALRLRDGSLGSPTPMTFRTFTEAFPLGDHTRLHRDVGGRRR
ncbi:hypothetical protein AS149_25835 [Burkholderia cenocepacia]|nr:hypothetical protein AS149_25835 [Burkholderia cenocepacia]